MTVKSKQYLVLQGKTVLFIMWNVTGTNLILMVQVSYVEKCLLDATQDYTSILQYLFHKVFLKLVALNKLLLIPTCVKKQCLFCVIVSTFDKLYSDW